ncbi:MAG: MarR family winged helix-turn-helix transcriptional regulator [Burkholderiaceae bacterium]
MTQRQSSAVPPDVPPFYCGETYVVDESIGYLVRQLFHSLQKQIDAGMQEHDLTAMQWGPLFMLANGKGDTAAALAREAGTDTGAMTRMLDRLEAKGLVERRRSDADRRVVNLALTDEGRRAAQKIPHTICDVLNCHLRGFREEELTTLKTYLRRMIANGQPCAGSPCETDERTT